MADTAPQFDWFAPAEVAATQVIDWGNAITSTVPSEPVAQDRAKRYDLALGYDSPGQESLFNTIGAGEEDRERERLAVMESFKTEQHKQAILESMLAKGTLTPQDQELILGMSKSDLADPKSYFEKRMADTAVSLGMLTAPIARQGFEQGKLDLNDPLWRQSDFARKNIFIQQSLLRKYEDLKQKFDETPYFSLGADEATRSAGERKLSGSILNWTFVHPFFMNSGGNLPGSSFWFGTDLRAQKDFFWNMDNENDSVASLLKRADEIYERSPQAALEWLSHMMSFSSEDQYAANLRTLVDMAALSTGFTASAIARATAKGARRLSNTLTKVQHTLADPKWSTPDLLEALGRTDAAAAARARENLQEQAGAYARNFEDIKNRTTALQNPQATIQGAKNLSVDEARRLEIEARRGQTIAQDIQAQLGHGRLERLPEGAKAVAYDEAERSLLRSLDANDAIVHVGPGNIPALGLDTVVARLGQRQLKGSSTEIATAEGSIALKAANDQGNKLQALRREYDDVLQRRFNAEYSGKKNVESFKTQLANIQKKIDKEIAKQEKAATGKANVRTSVGTPIAGKTGLPWNRLTHSANDDLIITNLANADRRHFTSKEQAERFAKEEYQLKPGGYRVIEDGPGFLIETWKFIDETLPSVRAAIAQETAAQGIPTTAMAGIRGLLRLKNRSTALGKELFSNYLRAGYSSQGQLELWKTMTEPAQALSKESRKDMTTFMERQRDFQDPETGQQGRFSRTGGEFEQDWFKEFKRLPTVDEASAYWSLVRASDLDWVINSANIVKGKARLGIETWDVGLKEGLEGKALRDMPHQDDRSRAVIGQLEDDGTFSNFVWEGSFGGKMDGERITAKQRRERIQEEVRSGKLKAIQLTPTSKDQLKALLGDAHPEYSIDILLVKNASSSPLTLNQLPYRPGGHRAYVSPFFISQEVVERRGDKIVYRGDKNILAFDTRSFGEAKLRDIESARKLLFEGNKTGDFTALQQFLEKNLPWNLEDFKAMWKGYSKDAFLDPAKPLRIREAYRDLDSMYDLGKGYGPGVFIRSSEDRFNLYNSVELKWAQERNETLQTIAPKGSQENPGWMLRPATMLDPMVTLERAARNLINAKYVDDLQIRSAEEFIQNFAHVLKPTLEEMGRDPVRHLLEPQWKEGLPLLDRHRLAAKDFRRSALTLLDIKSPGQELWSTFKNWMADSLYRTLGEKSKPAVDWINLSTVKDPSQYLRSLAFYEHFGFFNPAVFWQQAMGVLPIIAIDGSPGRVFKGANAGYLLYGSRKASTDAVKASLENVAVKTGWKLEHFREMRDAFFDSGFDRVGSNQAVRGDILHPDTGRVTQLLDKGTVFFRAGQGATQYLSYPTAYLQWREANPTAKLTNKAKSDILAQADRLALSPTRASRTPLMELPVMNLITQYWHTQAKMFELLWGKDLTKVQKLRLTLANATLFGAPAGAAGWTFGVPFSQWLRESDAANSKDREGIERFLAKGAMNYLIEELAGGRELNTDRLALSGIPFFYDFIGTLKGTGKESVGELFTGASGTTLYQNMASLSGFMTSLFMSIGNPDAFKIAYADLEDATKNISAANVAWRAYGAYNAGIWVTKKGMPADTISGYSGMFAALTGLPPMTTEEAYAQMAADKSLDKFREEGMKKFANYMTRALKAKEAGDDAGFDTFFHRAQAEGIVHGFRPQDYTRAWNQIKTVETLVERAARKHRDRVGTPEAEALWLKKLMQRENSN